MRNTSLYKVTLLNAEGPRGSNFINWFDLTRIPTITLHVTTVLKANLFAIVDLFHFLPI